MGRRKAATPAATESNVPAPVEGPTGTFSIWKPLDTEFWVATDFQMIADALSKPIDQVVWNVTDGIVSNDIDGHVLSGHA